MFDIGFAELIIIGIVALLVIGPERLPSTIRTASLWLNRIRRGYNQIKQEVQQELHNDSVMQELRETGEKFKHDTNSLSQGLKDQAESAIKPLTELEDSTAKRADTTPPEASTSAAPESVEKKSAE